MLVVSLLSGECDFHRDSIRQELFRVSAVGPQCSRLLWLGLFAGLYPARKAAMLETGGSTATGVTHDPAIC